MDFLAVLLSETNMQIVIAVVFITGIVRGFSGFGSGMIIGPTTAAFYGPTVALPLLSIVDALPTIPLVWQARKQFSWSDVLPVVIGYAVLIPLGVWVLKTSDASALRWFISISILVAVSILWSGWKYTGPRNTAISASVGAMGGFMGAAAALPGPAVLIYWLASSAKAARVRANMIYYLFLTDILVMIGYFIGDIYTWNAFWRAMLCIPGYLTGIAIGTRFFKGASEATYRRVAFIMIFTAAISSLPILDTILR